MVSEHQVHPSPNARPPPTGERLRSRLAKRVWLGVLTLMSGATVSALGALHGVRPAQRICALALLLVGSTQVVNSLRRLREGHREVDQMGRKLLVELIVLAVVPLGVGGCVLAHEPSVSLLAAFAGLLFVCLVIAAPLEWEIARSLAENRKRPVTAWVRSLKWPARWFFGDRDKSLGDALAEAGGVVAAVGGALLDVPPGTIGLVRSAMVATLAGATLALVVTPFLALAGADSATSSRRTEVSQADARAARRQGPRQAGPDPNASAFTPPSKLAERWDHRCLTAPGAGAPASAPWAGRELHELYLGSSGMTRVPLGYEAPGALAGCTGKIERVRGSRDSYYTIATYPRTGEIGSVALDSARYGPALFIAPAALPVLALLRRYKALGGTPRHRVGHGDFYLLEVDVGTVVFVRAQYQQRGHPRVTEGYVQLEPPVAEAWMDCMREHHGWLWPVRRPLVHAGHEIAYDLVDDVIAPRYRVTVSYDPAGPIAHRALSTQTRYYLPPGHRLDEAEVVGVAATARR